LGAHISRRCNFGRGRCDFLAIPAVKLWRRPNPAGGFSAARLPDKVVGNPAIGRGNASLTTPAGENPTQEAIRAPWTQGAAMSEYHLSDGLAALADFLQVDSDLIKAATGGKRKPAAPLSPAEPSSGDVESFVRSLPEEERIALLVRVCSGGDPHVGTEMRRRCLDRCRRGSGAAAGPRRIAGELRAAVRHVREERERIVREEAEAKRRRKEEAKAKARTQRLDALARRGEAVWRQVEDLIVMRNQRAYEEATALLADIGEIQAAAGRRDSFDRRIAELCARHAKKETFIERLRSVGLPGNSRGMSAGG
jgi:hypothetical protein